MNIEESLKLMTIFYSKSTGKIKTIVSGKQNMNVYGDDKSDYNYGFLVVKKDDYLFNNFNKFLIKDKKVVLREEFKADIQKYIEV
ncbi:hypothetical protein LI064_01945 [Clostridium perfringens]|uniref:hypothetical protein n=1 Tax=Clostridium perfringens TaxID=1502 RepID=UPI0022466489|nr:hypothetical protein [Clostridium perfringens]MCX0353284.1 hypothetical protein [Clostridium perfringens]